MAEFPPTPIAPAEFLEGWLPKAFAAAEVPEDVKSADVALGICLEGEGGGEWVVSDRREAWLHSARGGSRVQAPQWTRMCGGR